MPNSLRFHKVCQKLANGDVTKEALNRTASLQQLTALLMSLVLLGVHCSVIPEQVLPKSCSDSGTTLYYM